MRTYFHTELDGIHQKIRLLGILATQAVASAVSALVHVDEQAARDVKRRDCFSDLLRYDVENACVGLMATQQPVARDLRELVAATLVAVELERCGDYAKGIAKAARRIGRSKSTISPYNLTEIEAMARGMLERAVDAFLSGDATTAQAVIVDDVHVDRLYGDLRTDVTADMMAGAIQVEGGLWLLHAGHCLERFADRTVTVAGRVFFVQNGETTFLLPRKQRGNAPLLPRPAGINAVPSRPG